MEVFRLWGTISINKATALADLSAVESAAAISSGKIGSAFKSIGDKAAKFIKLGAVAAVVGLTAAMGLGVKAASDYEDAMVELAKVTDPNTAGTVGAAIREMAKDTPLTHAALMGIAADAGRLGVEGVDNILNFTKTVAQISVATDIMATEAGTDFAKLLTLLGEDIDVVDELGSAINDLSNNMAASSSEIVDSMLRSSASLKGLDMGTDEIVALNAAMVEVSVSSRIAGTSLKTIALALKNPEKMVQLADALGITVDEFRELRQEDPVELFKKLAMMMDEGGIKAEELTGILGDSAAKLQALAKNWDGVEKAIASSNKQMTTATSLQDEYNLAADTFSAHMQTLKNNFNDIAIDVGNKLMPTLDNFMEWVKNNTEPISDMMVGLAEGLVSTFGWIVDHKDGIAAALAIIGAGIAAMGLASMVANLNPVSLIITAIALAVAALLIYWDDIVDFFKDIGSAVAGWVSGAWSAVKGFFGVGEAGAAELADGLRSGKEEVASAIKELMTPEEAYDWGKSVGSDFNINTGMQAGIDNTGGFTIGGDSKPSDPLGSFGGDSTTFTPPNPDDTVSAWQSMWDGILGSFNGFKDKLTAGWEETKSIVANAVGSIVHDTISAWWAQSTAHKEAMARIKEQTEDRLGDEKIALDTALADLKTNLADGLTSDEQYNIDRIALLDAYAIAKQDALDNEKDLLDDEVDAYKESRKSIFEILKDSVNDVLSALKAQLLAKGAAALVEAIALSLGLNPLAGPKYLEAAAYTVGAGGLQLAGFEEGAVFGRPTLLPPHMVAEGGVSEAYIPLKPSVLAGIGKGIVDSMSPSMAMAGGGSMQVDMRGLYDGATINVRNDGDITAIAKETHDLWKSRMRGLGRNV